MYSFHKHNLLSGTKFTKLQCGLDCYCIISSSRQFFSWFWAQFLRHNFWAQFLRTIGHISENNWNNFWAVQNRIIGRKLSTMASCLELCCCKLYRKWEGRVYKSSKPSLHIVWAKHLYKAVIVWTGSSHQLWGHFRRVLKDSACHSTVFRCMHGTFNFASSKAQYGVTIIRAIND